MKYGLPYKGGKTLIAKQLFEVMPSGDRFVDLFGGGGAMSHFALLSNKYKKVLYNELDKDVFTLFKNAITGIERGRYEWISREDFFRLKDSDPYVKFCWSFGSNGRSYMCGLSIEQYKKAIHYAVVFDDWAGMRELMPEVTDACIKAVNGVKDINERRLLFQKALPAKLNELNNPELINNHPLYKTCKRKDRTLETSLQSLENNLRLENLERLERLESLESLESTTDVIEFTNDTYKNYIYKPGDIVYCDPPYENTDVYNIGGFDSQKFYSWALSRDYDVYISSYELPSDFYLVKEMEKIQSIGKNKTITERLYCNHKQPCYKQLFLFDMENL